MQNEEIRLQRQLVHAGKIISLAVDQVRLPDGRPATREVVLHPGAVAILAVNSQQQVLLVRQFRYPVGECLWELPAGKLEPGEAPEQAARRELAEETGYTAERLQLLYTLFTAPGFCDEKLLLYLAGELRLQPAQPDDDEFITAQAFSRAELRAMLTEGRIRDGKTLAGLLHYLSV